MSDLINRQAAIDALRTCYDTETISMDNGDEYINYGDAVGGIEQLPPAQPETSILTVTVAPNPEEIERVVRKIKDAPVTVFPPVQPKIIYCKDCNHLKRSETSSKLMMCQRRGRLLNLVGEFDFCSKAERRTDG